ncbi:hypothetical protein phytr_8260 [Candidatus Phycorickettsia trachydisci]|uniref:UDP-3-O-acylglucosamine N-acyltransferase n=1 Tax=Candidatus Phycorickettsia trachydisci TaxID=2115978 RepID=A0A2P1P910_9RICK|nr:UDP-3-O-(3-hydroxymyristoyl)glucosamine N-acyltransferase [Candidatus Phycorickettsia trachydisci]AVP87758.1 hypothetical protein phytr_8260 [Candidatus Phycorickettsia trachydisci]
MADSRFYETLGPFSLEYVLNQLGGVVKHQIQDSSSIIIKGVASLENAGEGDVSIFAQSKYKDAFLNTKASCCITNLVQDKDLTHTLLIETTNPYYAFSEVIKMFHKDLVSSSKENVSSKAKIGGNCRIGHNVIIEDNVEIGDNCIIDSWSVIRIGSVIGENSHIGANCYISHSIIGKRAIIFPGACIGREGFGIATADGKHKKIFHIGRVIIGDDVEIGANSVVERGSISDTIISDMCKISHLALVGHNVSLGYGCVVVGQSGIAGSTSLGKYCSLGGQAGISGHLKIADGVQVAAKSGVIRDITENAQAVGGYPAIPIKDWHKQTVILQKIIKDKDIS